eukprot:TRINITY_DN2969_c2_g5_i1.p1 TRINITY_DN2969_c2_g5~~TRINITY_DN2969_c2_g5_i1.p1  ORF type:complete len:220 (-),score=46.96 TRINITY_DN2969_c2_g5_i1:564-1223(-)
MKFLIFINIIIIIIELFAKKKDFEHKNLHLIFKDFETCLSIKLPLQFNYKNKIFEIMFELLCWCSPFLCFLSFQKIFHPLNKYNDIFQLNLSCLSHLDINSHEIFIYSFLSTLIHEFGHLFACFLMGVNVSALNIKNKYFLFRGCIDCDLYNEKKKLTSNQRIIVFFGGVSFNFLSAIMLNYLNCNFVFQCILLCDGMFNSLPFQSFDGLKIVEQIFFS